MSGMLSFVVFVKSLLFIYFYKPQKTYKAEVVEKAVYFC